MRYLILTFFFIATFSFVNGQTAELELKLVNKDYYAWITSLNEGPVNWLDELEGEIANIEFSKWVNKSTFQLQIQNQLFSVTIQPNNATIKLAN